MKQRINNYNFIIILTEAIVWMLLFFYIFSLTVNAKDQVASFDQLIEWIENHKSTGGTITLTDDITICEEEVYEYVNAKYENEITVDMAGHTIYVEGYLDLWPYIKIIGKETQKEIFHVCSGGELRLVSIQVDAGETGTAIVQEEGSFLMYGSEEEWGLPPFLCNGRIIPAKTITAAAYSWYNFKDIPVIRIPEEENFTSDLLPNKVMARVNREYQDLEEEVDVAWDTSAFPKQKQRTLLTGTFVDGYSAYKGYVPRCLIVWESETTPFFLNAYTESDKWYDNFFIYGETPKRGYVYIQGSDDGENWKEITNAEEYEPIRAEENDTLEWYFYYSKEEMNEKIPRYFRMVQELEDGTEVYSESMEISEDNLFVQADIGGGRGGEISPLEGEDRLQVTTEKEEFSEPSHNVESGELEENKKNNLGNELKKDQTILKMEEEPMDPSSTERSEKETEDDLENSMDNNSSDQDITLKTESDKENTLKENADGIENTKGAENATQLQGDKKDEKFSQEGKKESVIGMGIVLMILLGSVIFTIKYKKK